jgi:hypothetical protein
MPLSTELRDYINAAFTGIWIQSQEADEAEREIRRLGETEKWRIAAWDVAHGLRAGQTGGTDQGGDPLAALRALATMADPKSTTILLLHNFHKFLNSPEVVQTTFAQLVSGKDRRAFLVVIAPVVQIPVELEKLFVVLEHALPDREQIQSIALETTSEKPEDMPVGEGLDRVLDAAAGLTRYEAEGAFALSLARHNAIRPDVIWELKAQTLRKNNLLTLHPARSVSIPWGD